MRVHQEESLAQMRDEIRRLREEQHQMRQALDSNGHPATEEKAPEKPQQQPRQEEHEDKRPRRRSFFRRHPIAAPLGIVLLIAVLIGGFFLLRYFHSYESTDDAQVDGHLDPIGARIAGTVTGVYVENDYFVNPGEVLVDLDPRDYQVALEQAQAAYQQALRQVTAINPNVPITQTTTRTTVSTTEADVISAQAGVAAAEQDYEARLATLRESEAQNVKAQADLRRYELLVGKDEIPATRS